MILGRVGSAKPHLAQAPGHIAYRRGRKVHAERADRLFKGLTAARLDHLRHRAARLIAVDGLAIDDFARQTHDAAEATEFYEIAVEVRRPGITEVVDSMRGWRSGRSGGRGPGFG